MFRHNWMPGSGVVACLRVVAWRSFRQQASFLNAKASAVTAILLQVQAAHLLWSAHYRQTLIYNHGSHQSATQSPNQSSELEM